MRLAGLALLALLATASGCGKGLNGVYLKCVAVAANTSYQAQYTFIGDGTSVAYQSTSFNSNNCSGTAGNPAQSSGTFTTAASAVSNATNVNFTYGSGALNGVTVYQIYRLDGARFFVGDASGTTDATSDAKRPTAFETTAYVKQ